MDLSPRLTGQATRANPDGVASANNGEGMVERRRFGRAPASGGPPTEGILEQLFRIIRNRKWVVLQALVIVPAAALALSLLQPSTYTAQATLLFRPSVAERSGGFEDPDRAAATNDELVQLPILAALTSRALGGRVSVDAVASSVEVDSSGQSNLVEIQATDEQPQRAALIANKYGEAFITFRRRADRRQIQSAIAIVQRNLAALRPADRAGPEGRELTARLEELQTAELLQTGNAELVQSATAPSSPSSPRIGLNLALGILFGAALGLGLAALLESVDRRLKRVEELEAIYHLPVIARIPSSRTYARRDGGLPTLSPSLETEAFRTLRTNLRYYSVDRPVSSILVVSPLPGDGKSTVARYLAMTMASMGDSVVLVETDLHRGADSPFSDGSREGLSSVLAGSDLDDALIQVPVVQDGDDGSRRLWTLPSGPLPPNSSELLGSARMRSTIAGLEERFDLVILDTPALSVVSDALPLVPEVSGVLIVSALGHTTREAALELQKQLSLLEGRPLGIVANYAASERGSDRGAYYGRSGTAGAR